MRWLCALGLVLASRPQAPQPPPNGRTYGVAWTRNNARPGDVEQLRELYVSAASLRRRGRSTPTTLFTELARHDVDAAMRYFADEYGHARPPTSLFDAVLNVSDAAAATREIPRPLREAAAASLANVSAERRDLATSRLGRLHHFARAPYDVTLFLDDDTAFCADAAGEATLALALRDVDAPPSDAQCGNQPLVQGVLTKKFSNLSSSVKSKSIRLIFGRIDSSPRVLEAEPKIWSTPFDYANIEVGLKI